jgi:hypothetical protein
MIAVSGKNVRMLEWFAFLRFSPLIPPLIDNAHRDKKENQIFLIYKEILNGAVAKSYMTNDLLIY